jgi:heterodisulfide reductase subunit A-like polyferredoxin
MVSAIVGIGWAGVFANPVEILSTIAKAEFSANHEAIAIQMNKFPDPLFRLRLLVAIGCIQKVSASLCKVLENAEGFPLISSQWPPVGANGSTSQPQL